MGLAARSLIFLVARFVFSRRRILAGWPDLLRDAAAVARFDAMDNLSL